jgi:hypothetical protein
MVSKKQGSVAVVIRCVYTLGCVLDLDFVWDGLVGLDRIICALGVVGLGLDSFIHSVSLITPVEYKKMAETGTYSPHSRASWPHDPSSWETRLRPRRLVS